MSKCVVNQGMIQKNHGKFYREHIKNTKGYNPNVDYDKNIYDLISVGEFHFIVHKNDTCIADTLRSGTLFEKFILSYVKQFINPSKNIIDLGANIGTHSVIYSTYTAGAIYSFEPQKVVYDILNKNIDLNRCNNVITYNFGGSNVNSKFYMNAEYDNKHNQGAFAIQKGATSGLEIECRVIDEMNLTNIGYIKIDVEGHEYEALLGMKELIKREKPIILVEIHESSPTRNETIILLIELGYTKHHRLSHCDYLFFC